MRIESQLQLARRVPEYKIKKLSFVNSGEERTYYKSVLIRAIYFHKHNKLDEVNNYDIQRKP